MDGRLQLALRADELGAEQPLDPQAMFDYLYFHMIPSPRTIFQGVRRLPSGHVGVFDAGDLEINPYWVPCFVEPIGSVSFDALKTEFRRLLRQCVADSLGLGRAACFLSGGTDSSTVAGMIREATGQAPASYSIGFDVQGYDEMAYARIAAKAFGTDHHEYYVTPDDLVAGILKVAASFDQPFGNSSAVPAYFCARAAADDGVTRMLAGDGGDEFFGGNSRYAKQRIFDAYGNIPGVLRRSVLEPLLVNRLATRISGLKKGSSYIEQARLPMPDRLELYNLLLRLGMERVLTREFLAQADIQAPLVQQRQVWRQAQTENDINRTLSFDWRYTLAENDLPKVRGATQLAGVEVRFPLLDRRLLDFSLELPVAYKLKGLTLRWFFKEALRGFLPDEILAKKKHGFGLPFGVWALGHAGLKALARDSLGSFGMRGIIREDFLRELMERLLPEHPGYYGEMVWIVMMLEQWLRFHRPDYRFES
jgi:asparagine synthase (glutamine-hydrolysing)